MRSVMVLMFAACSASPARPAPPPDEPAMDCSKPSRACTYVALAKATPDLAAYATSKYGPFGSTALAALRERGLEALIVDVGVVLQLEKLDAHTRDPWRARARLAAKLGTRRVYRAVAVTGEVDRDLRAHGMIAPPAGPGGVITFWLSMHWVGALGDRLHGTIAVHDSADIARCIAYRYATDDQHVVVYALDLPALDVLALDPHANLCRAVEKQPQDCSDFGPPSMADMPLLCHFYDATIESVVAHRIEASEIASATIATRFDDCKLLLQAAGQQAWRKMVEAWPRCTRK
jgi:hypothetical protein